MQTMPTFVYLLPVVLFFGIGVSAAVVSTLIYALPPLIRIAGFGIREVSDDDDRGHRLGRADHWQRLCKVQLPMARKTIIVGPQPDHAGRAVDGHPGGVRQRPGPGQARARRRCASTTSAAAFVPGRADRGDGRHARPHHHGGQRASREGRPRRAAATSALRRIVLAVGGCRDPGRGLPLAPYIGLAEFPELHDRRHGRRRRQRLHGLGSPTSSAASTGAFKDAVTNWFLNPMQSLLAESPWWSPASPSPRWPSSFGGAAGAGADGGLPGRHLVLRPVARRDDHAQHDAGGHRPGDGAGPGLRGLDGPRPHASTSASGRCSTPGRRSRRSST